MSHRLRIPRGLKVLWINYKNGFGAPGEYEMKDKQLEVARMS